MAEQRELIGDEIPLGYPERLYKIRHSCAHILAQAVMERFASEGAGSVLFGVGPPIENGFYYDFGLPRSLTDEDLLWLEDRVKEIIRQGVTFECESVSIEKAQSLFSGQPYKLELLDGILAGAIDENGEEDKSGRQAAITIYKHDQFSDLCRGPHVKSALEIQSDAVKLLSVAGAYWRGDEHRPMLQRIYGTAFESKELLDKYLWQLAETERRDHRLLGKQLELFHFDPTAPGMPYWLPNGMKVINELLSFWRIEHEKRGYQEISSPLINEKRLWEISGHWEHYKENMFLIPVSDQVTYGVKPMNCPNAMVVFNLKVRSYRDLPLRLSDCDVLHRHERSGTLHGLLRVQKMQQDDAHIFLSESMIEDEYSRIFEIIDLFYSLFELPYSLRLGTRPQKFVGNIDTWNAAEDVLRRILDRHVGPSAYVVQEGDGAFYGPKIDILMEDAIGRSWQMGTIQLDFQLPRRFGCKFTDSDGNQKVPVVIHRVIYGALERFIGILIEHTAGAFPPWLSPVQICVVPISEKHTSYCNNLSERLQKESLRVEMDDSKERLNAKIRHAELKKIPYIVVVGDREVESDSVSVRSRSTTDSGIMSTESFVAMALSAVKEKKS